jgi:hypothetical protein
MRALLRDWRLRNSIRLKRSANPLALSTIETSSGWPAL